MKEETGKSSIFTVGGVKLPKPIEYEFKYSAYENGEELKAAGDTLSIDEQVKARNTERANNARAKQAQVELEKAGIEKPNIENNKVFRFNRMLEILTATGLYDAETARATALTNLNMTEDDLK